MIQINFNCDLQRSATLPRQAGKKGFKMELCRLISNETHLSQNYGPLNTNWIQNVKVLSKRQSQKLGMVFVAKVGPEQNLCHML